MCSKSLKKYQVILEGKNLLLDHDGNLRKTGFSTIRYVEAARAEEAEKIAVDLVKTDTSLIDTIQNLHDDNPMVYISKIYEVESFENEIVPGTGYTFYPEQKSWWKFW